MYKSRERRTAPGRAVISLASSFFCQPPPPRHETVSSLSLVPAPSPSLSLFLALLRRPFRCLYKPRTSANCSQRAYTRVYVHVYMCHVPLATNRNYRVDLKDVNCHLRKETVYKNAGESLPGGGFSTSIARSVFLPIIPPPRKSKKKIKRERKNLTTNRFTERRAESRLLSPEEMFVFLFFRHLALVNILQYG